VFCECENDPIRQVSNWPDCFSTPNALAHLSNEDILTAIQRHQAGDWGEVDEHDRVENELSLQKGFRRLSVYRAGIFTTNRVMKRHSHRFKQKKTTPTNFGRGFLLNK